MSLYSRLGAGAFVEARLEPSDVAALRTMVTVNSPLWKFFQMIQILANQQRLTISQTNFTDPNALLNAARAQGQAAGMDYVIETLDKIIKENNDDVPTA